MKDPRDALLKYLDCSTCHIRHSDSKVLWRLSREPEVDGPTVYAYREGFWVHVGEHSLGEPDVRAGWWALGLSEELTELCRRAADLGAEYLRLDADGHEFDGFPSFDW
jgi:hypothetical protein